MPGCGHEGAQMATAEVPESEATAATRDWARMGREGSVAGRLVLGGYSALMRLVELPINGVQRAIGADRMAWTFLAPNLALFAAFFVAPLLLNFYFSLTGSTSIFPVDRPFIGRENYATLLQCDNYLDVQSCRKDLFWRSIYNTLFFVPTQVGVMVVLSLVTALALNREIVARGFFRSVFFYPVLLSPVVVALIWKWILQKKGLLNGGLEFVGLDTITFLISPAWTRFWAIAVSVWAHMGFYTLILLAGLQGIPRDVYEAADMDGTSNWRTFWRITLPLLMPTMLVVLVLALIRAVQIFDEIFVLTGGGPGTATLYIVQFIYETGFVANIRQFGLAAAASVMLGVVLMILTMTQLWAARRKGGL